MSDLINTQLGQYRLIELIGQGGMATVYKAHQPSLDRFVAIKVLPRTHDPLFAARFKREARAIAQLQHHNILPIHDYGEQDGLLYLVLQYISSGVTLGDLLGKPMEPTQALRLTGRILDALEYAHTQNIIHRDIKPSNILMSSPAWPMLADFGIAKLLNESQSLTLSGLIVGTVAYMAPEQATSRPVDARTDLYATGVMLYEMVTGRVPFDADTPLAMLMKHAYESPPSPRSINPELPITVESVMLRALAKDPAGRYQSAAEMAVALERAAARLDRARSWNETTRLYETGVQAVEAGRWDEAVGALSRLVTLDPAFEDAEDLLAAAQLAQQRGRAEAILSSEPPKLAEQGGSDQQSQPIVPSQSNPRTATASPSVKPISRSIRPSWWFVIGGTTVLLVLIAVLLSSIGGGQSRERSTTLPFSVEPIVGAVQTAPTMEQVTVVRATAIQIAASVVTMTAVPTHRPTSTSNVILAETQAFVAAITVVPTPEPAPDATVNLPLFNLRAGPSQAYSVLDVYVDGTVLKVVGKERTGAWVQVQVPDGKVGWMSAAGLQVNIDLTNVPVVVVPTPKIIPTRVPPATNAPAAIDTPTPISPPVPVDTPLPTDPPTPVDPPTPTAMPTNTPSEDKREPTRKPRSTNTPLP